jgi:hypothetical protein
MVADMKIGALMVAYAIAVSLRGFVVIFSIDLGLWWFIWSM